MLWLAIHFPALPLDLWIQDDASGRTEAPLAILERQRVCRANAAARAQGVQPGLGAAAASALCPSLTLRERQTAREQRLLAALAQSALAFTPQVCVDSEDTDSPTLLLEIGGCLRLFRGLAPLLTLVDAHFAAQQVTVQRALAGTPAAARLLAVNGRDTQTLFAGDGTPDAPRLAAALAGLPLAGLALDPRTEESLMNMGFRQFGDINALPRHTLARRFGKPFALWLDRVTGAAADPRAAIRPETFFVRELNFLDGIVHTEGLAFPMQRLLGDFSQWLRRQQLATQHIVWRCTSVDHGVQEIVVRTSRPETSPAQWMALTRVHLDTLRLAAPVETLRLACRQFVPLAGAGFADTLFPEHGHDTQRDAGVTALVDRLRARLGDENCREFALQDSWCPEHGQVTKDAQVVTKASRTSTRQLLDAVNDAPADATQRRRPLWLLPKPARIDRQGAQLCWHGALELLEGPERLDSDWWTQPVQRDYFVARHSEPHVSSAGVFYWVFHDRAQDTWFVHGVFG